jgi:hypothetical protein
MVFINTTDSMEAEIDKIIVCMLCCHVVTFDLVISRLICRRAVCIYRIDIVVGFGCDAGSCLIKNDKCLNPSAVSNMLTCHCVFASVQ